MHRLINPAGRPAGRAPRRRRPGVLIVNGPRHIYSADQHENLGPYGITFLGMMDAATRKVMHEVAVNNKRAVIHYSIYRNIVCAYYGACTIVRGDRGREN
eukprot:gene1198-6646_t